MAAKRTMSFTTQKSEVKKKRRYPLYSFLTQSYTKSDEDNDHHSRVKCVLKQFLHILETLLENDSILLIY